MDEQRWHTLITSTFMHGGILHLGLNMLTLWGIAGAILQTWYWKRTEPRYSNPSAVGASGCITGVLGAMTLFSPYTAVSVFSLPLRLWQSSLLLVGLSLAAIKTGTLPWIGHVDHLGGLAFGVVFCKSLPWPLIHKLRSEDENQLLTSPCLDVLALRRGRTPRRRGMY